MRFLTLLWLVYLGFVGVAQPLSFPIATWLEQPLMRGASVSMQVIDLSTDQAVFAVDEDRLLVPASIQKLFATGLLLQSYPVAYTVETKLAPSSNSTIHGDTLKGDLWLLGQGDPSLASVRMSGAKPAALLIEEIGQALKAKGISVIHGSVTGVPLVFPNARIPGDFSVKDAGNYYAAPTCGLSWQDNTYTLVLQSSTQVVNVLRMIPLIPGLQHQSFLVAEGSTDQAYIMGMPYQYDRQVVGAIPPNQSTFTIKGGVPDPALFVAQQVQALLEDEGIQFTDAPKTAKLDRVPVADVKEVWWTHTSPALSALLQHTMERSDNFFAETWVRWLFPNDNNYLELFEQEVKRFSGNAIQGRITDGSGLSRTNTLSANDFTAFLRSMYHSDVFASYLDIMAKAGANGTMRMVRLPEGFKGVIYGKSGYMTGVRSYAGYYQSGGGRWYAFALIANNFNGSGGAMRQALTEIMAAFDQLP